jgi:protein ImuB
MFACIYGRSVSESLPASAGNADPALVDLAFTFSPLVEQTTADTVVLNISGQDLLFGSSVNSAQLTTDAEINSAHNLAKEIFCRARQSNLKVNVSVAANPDSAIHAARSFKGITIIKVGEELLHLGTLSIKRLDHSLAGVDAHRVEEIQETFILWGVRTFGDLASLPLAGVAERLGQEGVRLQKLAQGQNDRRLNLIRPPIGFDQSLELEHPVTELEPLSFILSRLLNQLCANLDEYALATNELRLRLVTEPGVTEPGEVASASCVDSDAKAHLHERTITFPVPMRNPKTLLRLLLFDIEAQPPCAPIVAVTISAEPVKPRASQTGLFIPLAPEPEKLEITLARLAKLVGADNVGSPEVLDTHRPDAFRMKRFRLNQRTKRNANHGSHFALNASGTPALPVMGFRVFRPPWRVEVQTMRGQPTRISARANSSDKVRGKIVCASGPWRTSGDWWRTDVWARDEWDVAVIDAASQESEIFCRIYRDLSSEQWFVAGIYD